jgi:pentatricopeptide repeat protein
MLTAVQRLEERAETTPGTPDGAQVHFPRGASLRESTPLLPRRPCARAQAYNRAMRFCARAARSGAGREAMEQGRRVLALMRTRDVAVDVQCYTNLVDACAKVGAEAEAEAVLDEMSAGGVSPNVVTFAALLSVQPL